MSEMKKTDSGAKRGKDEECSPDGTVIDPKDGLFKGLSDLKQELGPKEFLRRYEEFLKSNGLE